MRRVATIVYDLNTRIGKVGDHTLSDVLELVILAPRDQECGATAFWEH